MSGLSQDAEVHLYCGDARHDDDVYLSVVGLHYDNGEHVSLSCQQRVWPRQKRKSAESAATAAAVEKVGEQTAKNRAI